VLRLVPASETDLVTPSQPEILTNHTVFTEEREAQEADKKAEIEAREKKKRDAAMGKGKKK
jgi:hypothetical protein